MSTRCITPFYVNTIKQRNVPVPCGKCPACKKRRVSGWSFRLMQQDKYSLMSHFITLTYDNSNIPITPKGFASVSKRDVQLFFKRLRKSHTGLPIVYYLAAEYGSKTARPHYHIILFNSTPEAVARAWTAGLTHAGTVTAASVGYTLKYISKPGRIPLHKNDDRVPEFTLMSKGIGLAYLTPAVIKWHKNPVKMDERMYCNVEDKKISMPRYYKNKLYNEGDKFKIVLNVMKRLAKEYTPTELEKLNSDLATIASYNWKQKQSSEKL